MKDKFTIDKGILARFLASERALKVIDREILDFVSPLIDAAIKASDFAMARAYVRAIPDSDEKNGYIDVLRPHRHIEVAVIPKKHKEALLHFGLYRETLDFLDCDVVSDFLAEVIAVASSLECASRYDELRALIASPIVVESWLLPLVCDAVNVVQMITRTGT